MEIFPVFRVRVQPQMHQTLPGTHDTQTTARNMFWIPRMPSASAHVTAVLVAQPGGAVKWSWRPTSKADGRFGKSSIGVQCGDSLRVKVFGYHSGEAALTPAIFLNSQRVHCCIRSSTCITGCWTAGWSDLPLLHVARGGGEGEVFPALK